MGGGKRLGEVDIGALPTFSISLADGRLDVSRCLSSGQIFRWEQLGPERTLVVDGDGWFLIEEHDRSLTVTSNQEQDAFDRLFRLDVDAGEVEDAILRKGPELAPYADALRGLRLLRPSVPEEVFFCFLCSANNHIARIGQMVRKLAAYGEKIGEVEGRPVHRFPEPARIASIPEEELRSQGFGYRGASIPTAAKQLADRGPGWLGSLRALSCDEIRRELVAIHSVGPKLADCIALFGLHRTDIVPIDTHMWQALTRLYFPEWASLPLTAARYREAALFFQDRFGEHTGWAQQYLFYENVLNWRGRRG